MLRCAFPLSIVSILLVSSAVGADRPVRPFDEQGCLEGRIQDYLLRHGDYGRIDPEVLLYVTREFHDQLERERRMRALAGISGTAWTSIGPTNGAGRATAIAPFPGLGGNLIIGAAGGGAWKTTDGGTTWTPLTETIPNLSVGAIAIAPSSPSTIYLGSGEGGYAIDFIPGIGLLASSDGGTNWTLPTSVLATEFYKISVHPTIPNELVVGTNAGALRSTGGQNGPWTTVIRSASAPGVTGYADVTDLVRDPSNALVLYATTWDRGYWCANGGCADPYNFASPTVLKSVDGGQTWSVAATGLPVSTATKLVNRMAIAIAPSSPQTLYVGTTIYDRTTGSEISHVYKTVNGGGLWTETALFTTNSVNRYLGGQGFYDNTIVVSPADPNIVVAGGVWYAKTTDGGLTWTSPSFSVHVDAHELRYDAAGTLFIANDGGIYSSTDNGTTASARNTGLVTRQFYVIANDPVNRNRVFGGQQDNGTSRRPDSGGTAWNFFTGSDGFACAVNSAAPEIAFSSSQYGTIMRSESAGATSPSAPNASPLYAASEIRPFLTLLTIDPPNPNVLYTGSYRVWKSTNAGESWLPLPTTTTDGSTWRTDVALRSIAVASSDSRVLMVANAIGAVFRSADGGNTWVSVASGLGGRFVNHLEIDPLDATKAYASLAGMSGTSVYYTTNSGASWSPRGSGLPSFSAQVVRVDPLDSNTLYCGTDVGVYRSTDGGVSWSRFGTGMPAVSTDDIRALSDGSILRVGTHGRGVWELGVPASTNHPPTVSISAPSTPQTIARGASITFTGAFSDPDSGDSASGRWSFPDSSTLIATASGVSVTHRFDRAGVFPVTLTATDTHGAISAASVNITVTEMGDPCNAPIVIPASGPFPYSVSFDTRAATVEATDPVGPSCDPFAPQNSIWLSFTPAVTGTYQFSLCGSKTSAEIWSFTGNACGPYTPASLCLIQYSPASDCTTAPTSSIALTAGQTLRLLVDNYFLGDFGPVTLTVTQASVFSPSVASISPSSGSTVGGTPITVAGSGFVSGMSLRLGSTATTAVNVITPNLLTATTPAHPAGVVDVSAQNGGTTATLASAYTFVAAAAPTVTSIVPASGSTGGGTAVVITGTGFAAGATVTLSVTAATNVVVVSATSINAITPAHTAGAVDVSVRNSDGQSGTLLGGFLYTAPAPTIATVLPASGSTAGGTNVTITGSGFAAGATVTFGGTAATNVVVVSATSITATTPAHAAGAVTVAVTNTNGQSGTLTNGFTYVAPAPTVATVLPASGSTGGGTNVTITGTGFAAGATVTFGGTAAANVVVVSATSITATTPAHAAGVVNVVVTNADGQSGTLLGGFTYGAAVLPHGDANGDGNVTVADVFYMINFLFAGGPAPVGPADVNGDGQVTVADVFYLINYLFAGGPAPR